MAAKVGEVYPLGPGWGRGQLVDELGRRTWLVAWQKSEQGLLCLAARLKKVTSGSETGRRSAGGFGPGGPGGGVPRWAWVSWPYRGREEGRW